MEQKKRNYFAVRVYTVILLLILWGICVCLAALRFWLELPWVLLLQSLLIVVGGAAIQFAVSRFLNRVARKKGDPLPFPTLKSQLWGGLW